MIVSKLYQLLSAAISRRLKSIAGSGLSPDKLSQAICIGGAIGILPLPWGTTLLCVLLGYLFGLNQLVLQSLNYLFYPLQLVLLIPYCKLGAWLFPWGPALPPITLASLLQSQLSTTLPMFGWVFLKAIAAWLITAPPATLLIYPLLVGLSRKRKTKVENLKTEE